MAVLMIYLRRKLEQLEKKRLQPYAVLSSKSRGRAFSEPEDETRTCFQRDRDRIIHSKAFRRLSGKTQVFIATLGDHYRDRLSHTLEMAQISRDIARSLGLNEDLAEAIALAHDLGHTPFGHEGEHELDAIMKKFGRRFEHNDQSKHIVEFLEDRYPDFFGLNLSLEVREGLAKHQSHYDRRGKPISGKTLEAQVVDLADEIAYHNHDLDDGLRSRLFSFVEPRKLSLWKKAERLAQKRHGALSSKYLRHRTISALMSLMIADVCAESERRIEKWKIKTPEDTMTKKENAISFSPAMFKEIQKLRKFLWAKMYRSPKVLKHSRKGRKVLNAIFWRIYKTPRLLPEKLRAKIGERPPLMPLEVIVKDFVAGMTDEYAMKFHEKRVK